MRTCPYEILGLKPSADDAEVRRVWRNLLKDLHPDTLPKELSETARRLIESQAKEINSAYEEISRLRPGLKNARKATSAKESAKATNAQYSRRKSQSARRSSTYRATRDDLRDIGVNQTTNQPPKEPNNQDNIDESVAAKKPTVKPKWVNDGSNGIGILFAAIIMLGFRVPEYFSKPESPLIQEMKQMRSDSYTDYCPGAIASQQGLMDPLKEEAFVLAAIRQSHKNNQELSNLVDKLLQNKIDNEGRLPEFLKSAHSLVLDNFLQTACDGRVKAARLKVNHQDIQNKLETRNSY